MPRTHTARSSKTVPLNISPNPRLLDTKSFASLSGTRVRVQLHNISLICPCQISISPSQHHPVETLGFFSSCSICSQLRCCCLHRGVALPAGVLSRLACTNEIAFVCFIFFAGLSFTPEERVTKNLTGLLPHTMESLQTQCARAMKMIQTRQTSIDKYLYLSSLKDQNTDLFYRLLIDNVRDLMPLVYTPTIGDVCLQYSSLYTRPEALYISIKQRKSIRTMLRNWPCSDPDICVVTDGSRILGLGDLGMNGVGISVSKGNPTFTAPH